MLSALTRRLFNTHNERVLKRFEPNVVAINAAESEVAALSDDALKARTDWLRGRVAAGETLDDILVDAFATVREAAKRTLGQRHFDVQLTGGMVLHSGAIAEMATGEGKTLVATLPVYLNALEGKGVHVVTVNDYLAARDAEWMGRIYRFLGLTVGVIVHGLSDDERRAAYHSDITYGTNNEFGFDYLRDNMKFHLDEMAQRAVQLRHRRRGGQHPDRRGAHTADHLGRGRGFSELYIAADKLIPRLDAHRFEMDEKVKAVTLTESGAERIENMLREAGLLTIGSLYDIENVSLVHHANRRWRPQAVPARPRLHRQGRQDHHHRRVHWPHDGRPALFGRPASGARSQGSCKVESENQTLASITFQNYFRMYPKLAGMTGTALTEEAEFESIYKLGVLEIPTNLPCVRIDAEDEVYRTGHEKIEAIIEQIEECRNRKQPVLVGASPVEVRDAVAAL